MTGVAAWDIIDATLAADGAADKDGAADVMVLLSQDEGSSKGTRTRHSNAVALKCRRGCS